MDQIWSDHQEYPKLCYFSDSYETILQERSQLLLFFAYHIH